jgi:hypothetical protein
MAEQSASVAGEEKKQGQAGADSQISNKMDETVHGFSEKQLACMKEKSE